MTEIPFYVFVSIWLVVLAYIIMRVGSFAYFRTKFEYLRRVLHKINGG